MKINTVSTVCSGDRQDTAPTLMLQGYLDLTRDMMLAFGAVFELPLLIYFLSMIGVVFSILLLWKFPGGSAAAYTVILCLAGFFIYGPQALVGIAVVLLVRPLTA